MEETIALPVFFSQPAPEFYDILNFTEFEGSACGTGLAFLKSPCPGRHDSMFSLRLADDENGLLFDCIGGNGFPWGRAAEL